MIYPVENLKIDFDFERAAVGIGPYDSVDRLYDKLQFTSKAL